MISGILRHMEAAIRRIVVGVDGSAQAGVALDWAIRAARQTGAELVAVFVLHVPGLATPVEPAAMPPLLFDEQWRGEMRTAFESEWCAPLREADVPFRTHFEEGRPADVIAEVAEREQADLVVVGRRGRGGVAEFLLGSVSHELTHHCRRPVVLVPHERDVVGKG